MIDIDEAQRILFSVVTAGPTARVPLRAALFRTLAEPLTSDVDYPPFDRSVMDGYAVRSVDVAAAPIKLRISGRLPAGVMPAQPMQRGEAIQINTGAPIPPGADAVVRLEDTQLLNDGESVVIQVGVEPGHFITPRGQYVRANHVVLNKGQRVTPAEIGAAASAGGNELTIYKPPDVAVLSTGNELIDISGTPTGAQIRNSNQHQLEALIRSAHLDPVLLGVARDDHDDLRSRLVEGLRHDVLCITGGVSVGALDLVPGMLKELGAVFHIEKIAIKPGRPAIFATTPRGGLVFALPGNPISAFVGFELLVRPALAALEGRTGVTPIPFAARLLGSVPATGSRRTFHPARATIGSDGTWEAQRLSWHGSGDAFGLVGANAMIVRAPESPLANEGETVSVLWFPS